MEATTTGRPKRFSNLAFDVAAEDAVDRGATDSKGCRNGCGRFTAVVHATGQRSLLIGQRLGPTDCLAACATGIPRCRAALLAEFQLKLGEAGEHTGDHAACGGGRVDALPEGPKDDAALSEFPDGRHHFGGVAAQAVDTDDH